MNSDKRVIEFFEKTPRRGKSKGTAPVEELISSLTVKSQAQILKKLKLLAVMETLKEPHVKRIRGDILEFRLAPEGTPYRILFFIPEDGRVVLLHGFKKSSRKTPQREIRLAEARMMEYLERYN